jgi:hypothetical protein
MKLRTYNNIDNLQRYFERHRDSPKLMVKMERPNYERRYSLCKLTDELFRLHMRQYILLHLRMNVALTAVNSLQNFLNLYEITEDEFSFDAAYKVWQRSAECRQWIKERYNITVA